MFQLKGWALEHVDHAHAAEAHAAYLRAHDLSPGNVHTRRGLVDTLPPSERASAPDEYEEIIRLASTQHLDAGLLGLMGWCRFQPRSGFYAWERRPPSDRALADAWLTEKIRAIHQTNRGVYVAPRVHAELGLEHGVRVSRKRVERLMRATGISGLVPKRRGRTTIRVPGVRVADDLVDRDFAATGPNRVWAADITYLRTWEGWLYLAAVQDLFSRRIVG